jgi:hypothetical protein
MSAPDELLTIAEIAVSLIGFSGLIFVFRARDITELEPRDLSAIAMIMASGALALVFSLFPLPLSYLPLSEPVLWRISCGSFGFALLASSVAFRVADRSLHRSGHPERTPRLNRATVVVAVAMGALLTASSLGAPTAGPALYLFALIVCVLLCLIFVAFLLIIARQSAAS